jgi:hypothetical protein
LVRTAARAPSGAPRSAPGAAATYTSKGGLQLIVGQIFASKLPVSWPPGENTKLNDPMIDGADCVMVGSSY